MNWHFLIYKVIGVGEKIAWTARLATWPNYLSLSLKKKKKKLFKYLTFSNFSFFQNMPCHHPQLATFLRPCLLLLYVCLYIYIYIYISSFSPISINSPSNQNSHSVYAPIPLTGSALTPAERTLARLMWFNLLGLLVCLWFKNEA